MTVETMDTQEEYRQCALRALLEMFADSKGVSRHNVGLHFFTVIVEGREKLIIQPVVFQ